MIDIVDFLDFRSSYKYARDVAIEVTTTVLGATLHTGVSNSAPSTYGTRITHQLQARSFTISDFFRGQDLLQWDFFNRTDPTHGTVNYQSRESAMSKGLARLENGALVLAVDSWSNLGYGQYRDSVRIISPGTYTGGLFIADFATMPFGPTVWPAWWTKGPDWPNAGEIDVVEGINDISTNQYTLHTSDGCSLDGSQSGRSYTGRAGNLDCTSGSGTNNLGCQVMDSDTRSYDRGFNAAGGGVFAHLWDESGIRIWHFARSQIPADITNKKPNPSTWGLPIAFYSSDSCDTSTFFHDHVLIINTTICGDWAGNAFPGGMAACKRAVANPKNYSNAKWKINYVAVYN